MKKLTALALFILVTSGFTQTPLHMLAGCGAAYEKANTNRDPISCNVVCTKITYIGQDGQRLLIEDISCNYQVRF